jgi:hypothetical protein
LVEDSGVSDVGESTAPDLSPRESDSREDAPPAAAGADANPGSRKIRSKAGLVAFAMLTALAIVGACWMAAGVTFFNLDSGATQFAEELLPKMLSNLDAAALAANATPESAAASMKPAQYLTAIRAKLGRVVAYGGTSTQIQMTMRDGRPAVTALVSSDLRFDTGPARVRLELVKRGDRWLVDGLYVQADSLLH